MQSVFEKIVHDIGKKNADEYLQECMKLDPKSVKKIPVRYRLIFLGFLQGMSLNQVNEKLIEAGSETLYSRNFWEASLVYAFLHHISHDTWRAWMEEFKANYSVNIEGAWFSDRKISYRELEEYIKNGSEEGSDQMVTLHRTQILEDKIQLLSGEKAHFFQFMMENMQEFSNVREKTRYYFCKYLYYYMNQQIENYLKALEKGQNTEDCQAGLRCFMGWSNLTRKRYSVEEAESILKGSDLSYGGIYEAFNEYYFGYVSADWVEVLMEYYGNIEDLPEAQRIQVAKALRAYHPEWRKLSDEEVIQAQIDMMDELEESLDEAYSLDGKKAYQFGRSGENSVRKYMKGMLDIDRTTLICYLLFFNNALRKKKELYMDSDRLNHILQECHMPVLRGSDAFDAFVIQFMGSKDPTDYLMDTVTKYALEQKNFFLYHMYNDSILNDEQIRKVMGI